MQDQNTSDREPRALKHLWYPCSQMKDYEAFAPLEIRGAHGSYLELSDGRTLIDAISSWWCKTLGHQHPRLRRALIDQAHRFEHVILANTTNDTILRLSEKLAQLAPGLDKIFYGGDGSTAVEIAVKMSLQARALRGQRHRRRFAALENGYHGETQMAAALSDVGLYRTGLLDEMPEAMIVRQIPYVRSEEDPLWNDCAGYWPAIERQLAAHAHDLCAVVLEPILQGAGGMLIYSADLLRRLRQWTQANNVYLIADEILTGFGRTGVPLACDHAGITPDFICLSKGLTAGWLPMSAVLTSTATYALFYDDYETGKAFLHSNTYAGNPLAAAVALEAFAVYEEEGIFERVRAAAPFLRAAMEDVAHTTGKLKNVRSIGALVAADLDLPPARAAERAGYRVYREAVQLGALLRPLGNTLYWLLPLNVEPDTVERLQQITTQAIERALS